MPPEATASTTASGTAASAASTDDLKSIIYPKPGAPGGAASVALADDDHDPEFDDDKKEGADDPDKAGDDEGEAADAADGKKSGKAKDEAGDDAGTEDGDKEKPADDEEATEEEEGADETDEAKPKFTTDQQKYVDKLLGKKTEQNRDLRTKAEKLEGQNKALGDEVDTLRVGLPAPVATRDNPLADVTAEGELAKRERNAMTLRQWLMRNRDGGEMPIGDGKGGTVKITPEKRDELLAETDELMMVHLPARKAFIADRRAFDAEARKHFPDLKDPKSELSLRVDGVLRHYAALQSMPEARLFVADALANRNARLKATSSAAPARVNGAGARGGDQTQSRKAPRTEGAPRVAARADPDRKRADQASDRLAKTGRDDDNVVLAQLIGGKSR